MRKRIVLIVLLGLASGGLAQSGVSTQSAQSSAQKPKADLIFTHGNIFTGVVDAAASLGSGKRAEALAVLGDRILAVSARRRNRPPAGTAGRAIRPPLGA